MFWGKRVVAAMMLMLVAAAPATQPATKPTYVLISQDTADSLKRLIGELKHHYDDFKGNTSYESDWIRAAGDVGFVDLKVCFYFAGREQKKAADRVTIYAYRYGRRWSWLKQDKLELEMADTQDHRVAIPMVGDLETSILNGGVTEFAVFELKAESVAMLGQMQGPRIRIGASVVGADQAGIVHMLAYAAAIRSGLLDFPAPLGVPVPWWSSKQYEVAAQELKAAEFQHDMQLAKAEREIALDPTVAQLDEKIAAVEEKRSHARGEERLAVGKEYTQLKKEREALVAKLLGSTRQRLDEPLNAAKQRFQDAARQYNEAPDAVPADVPMFKRVPAE